MMQQSGAENLDFLAGGGETGALMRSRDWTNTPLGPAENWPQSLRTAVGICLHSRFPIILFWGPQLIQIYNDDYRGILGTKHPEALGQRAEECWTEIWPIIGPMLHGVLASGKATWSDDILLVIDRSGYLEEIYFTFSYSPIALEGGTVGGVFCAVNETTGRVVCDRRLHLLSDLSAHTADARTADEACRKAAETLASATRDITFALIYQIDAEGGTAELSGSSGLPAGRPASPQIIDLTAADTPWPLAEVLRTGTAVMVTDAGPLPGGAWDVPATQALVLPIARPDGVAGFLVAGISLRKALDENYRSFLDLIAGHIAAAIGHARTRDEERRRADALAELNRAKTDFFANVSHEFRTPLTLILGPLEQVLADPGLTADQRERLDLAQRNALRLQRMVETLLDTSRIEAGRAKAVFKPVDLAALTTDLAGMFRSAFDAAGLTLTVDCPPLPEPVWLDREMWEKIVLNLLSNAFKFTFDGGVRVALTWSGDGDGGAVLTVADTGTGIPPADLPHIFERFHRVHEARSRSFEGTGIGLALVRDLVEQHGGTITVTSEPDRGTVFTLRLPRGHAHRPADTVAAGNGGETGPRRRGEAFVAEALRWLPTGVPDPHGNPYPPPLADVETPRWQAQTVGGNLQAFQAGGGGSRPRIVLADDNADMRAYLARILEDRFAVETCPDGMAALSACRITPPDLVLTDEMMPGMSGFALLKALRSDERTREIPVVLLSARAGEEEMVEGLEAGADDYLVKPFSARELIARLSGQIAIARMRHEAERQRRLADEAQRETERRIADIAANFPGAIYRRIRKPDGTICYPYYSGDFAAAIGLPPVERDRPLSFQEALSRFLPEDRPVWQKALVDTARTLAPFRVEARVRDTNGRIRWICTMAHTWKQDDGTVVWDGVLLDISDLKNTERRLQESLAEKDILLREVHHRVKNNLQIISSLINMESRSAPDPASRLRFEALSRRIAVIGRNHEQIYAQSDLTRIDLARHLTELADSLSVSVGRPGVTIDVDAARLSCELDTALPIGLLAGELLTNSLKHAFPEGRDGHIRLSLQPQGAGRDVALVVADDGIGLDDATPEPSGSQGMVVVRALARQLEATVRIESGSGTRITVTMPGRMFV
jgi:signal transduction histidine kinase